VSKRNTHKIKGKLPTAEVLNARATAFWKEENARLEKQARDYPHEIAAAAAGAVKLIKAGHIADPEFASETSLNAAAEALEKLRKRSDSVRRRRGGEACAKGYIERDCRIHAASKAGKTPKQIAGDENLSPDRVRSILRTSRR
jgi:hypothetical protein